MCICTKIIDSARRRKSRSLPAELSTDEKPSPVNQFPGTSKWGGGNRPVAMTEAPPVQNGSGKVGRSATTLSASSPAASHSSTSSGGAGEGAANFDNTMSRLSQMLDREISLAEEHVSNRETSTEE